MMLTQNTRVLPLNTRALQHTPLRLAVRRCVATEQETAPSAAGDGSKATIQTTLSALDSLLPPPEPEKPQPFTTDKPSTSGSSSGISSIWQNEAVNSVSGIRQQDNSKQWFEQGFEGLAAAAEVINGRAAMLGFVAAVMKETHGDSLFAQLVSGGGVSAVWISLLVVVASMAPALRQVPFDKMFGKDKQPASFGPFTPAAELINGRAAMLGLIALVFIEGSNGQPFFM